MNLWVDGRHDRLANRTVSIYYMPEDPTQVVLADDGIIPPLFSLGATIFLGVVAVILLILSKL